MGTPKEFPLVMFKALNNSSIETQKNLGGKNGSG
jgi:hypothetical protein